MPYVRNILPSMVRAYRVICRGAAGCIPLPGGNCVSVMRGVSLVRSYGLRKSAKL